MKDIIKRLIPSKYHAYLVRIKNNFLDGYALKSYSQEGEDVILHRIFENQKGGFYVDVGAHHPKRFSNTYFFYKRGWKGINIDPMPGSMKLFSKIRPRDINLEGGISDSEGKLTYYIFDDIALNTFSRELADQYIQNGRNLIRKVIIEVYPLSNILDHYLNDAINIDFMSIDVEGLELQVIKSNDWNKYRPTVILVESLDFDLSNPQNSRIYNFLSALDYKFFAKTINTLFFMTKD